MFNKKTEEIKELLLVEVSGCGWYIAMTLKLGIIIVLKIDPNLDTLIDIKNYIVFKNEED